jgi:hypothetical protein
VLALDVADLMADVEVERVRIVGQPVHDVRIQHQEFAAEKARREGVQRTAHLQQISLRLFVQPELAAAGRDLLLELRELLLGDRTPVPLMYEIRADCAKQ